MKIALIASMLLLSSCTTFIEFIDKHSIDESKKEDKKKSCSSCGAFAVPDQSTKPVD